MATVDSIQIDAKNSADQYLTQAEGFLNAISAQVEATFPEITVPTPSEGYLLTTYAELALQTLRSSKPTRPNAEPTNIDAPNVPNMENMPNISPVTVPELTVNEPQLDSPTAPRPFNGRFPGDAPEFRVPAIPTKPTFTLPSAPVFSPIVTPEVPFVEFPTFTTAEPIDTITAPSYNFEFSETEYSSELLEALRDKLLDDLENGGYGIETQDETAIWERARERELAAASARMAELSQLIEGRGMTLPPGAYVALMGEAQQELLFKNSSASREVAINRAALFVQNRQFTIQQSLAFEGMYIQYIGFKAERALNAAKSIVELGISVFNSQVTKFNLRLEAYKIAANVYESKIRASLSKLEVFKTQVEAAKIDAERQRIYTEVYMAQIRAIEVQMQAYKTEVEAVRVKAAIEEARLTAFKTEVDAYLAQVQAKDTEFKVFNAQIDGNKAKVDLYEAQVRAYATKVQGLKTRSEVDVETARLTLENNRIKLNQYQADLSKHVARVETENSRVKNLIEMYRADITAYNSEVDVTTSFTDLNKAVQLANIEIFNNNFKQHLENAKFRFEEALRSKEFRFKAAEVGSNIHTNIGVGFANQLAAIATKAE